MEKVASMQALLADNYQENCGHFWMNNVFLAILTHKCPQNCVIVHIYPFLLHTISKLMFIQKCPQFSPKLSASNACMLATFSMSGLISTVSKPIKVVVVVDAIVVKVWTNFGE